MAKKFRGVVWLVITLVLINLLPTTASAGTLEEKPSPVPAQGQPAVSLEKAIELVKAVFPEVNEYSGFNSSYNEWQGIGSRAVWQLNWYSTEKDKGGKGNLSAQVDATTGELINVNSWDNSSSQSFRGLPQYTREDAIRIASLFLEKVAADKLHSLKMLDDQTMDLQPLSIKPRRPVMYSIRWVRLVNGIPFPANGVNITVNADTGKVQNYWLQWDNNITFPAADKAIPLEKARDVWREKMGLSLQYWRPYGFREDQQPVILTYQPVKPYQKLIDALTGEVLEITDGWIDTGPFNKITQQRLPAKQELEGAGGPGPAPIFSPAEQEEIVKNQNLLSKDQAMAIALKTLGLSGDAKLQNASLEQDWANPGRRIWRFNWTEGQKQTWFSASIDAKTGEIMSFDRPEPISQEEPKTTFTEEQAQKKAEEFLASSFPDKWKQVQISNRNQNFYYGKNPGDKPLPVVAYYFTYSRQVNGIDFSQNSLVIGVSGLTGTVIHFNQTWWDVSFPQPTGIIAKDKAEDQFMGKVGLSLDYVRIFSSKSKFKEVQPPEVKLVWHIPQAPSYIVDAVTGAILDQFTGKPLTAASDTIFTDIAGHPMEQDILLLAKAGIVSGDGEKFRPDDPVKQAEFIKMLMTASRDYYGPMPVVKGVSQGSWYQGYYASAAAKGIWPADRTAQPNAPVTQLDAIRLAIDALGYKEPAQLDSLWNPPVSNSANLPPGSKGYIAMALGFGIMDKEPNGTFNPDRVMTRAEAAQMIARMLRRK